MFVIFMACFWEYDVTYVEEEDENVKRKNDGCMKEKEKKKKVRKIEDAKNIKILRIDSNC